MSNDKVQTDQNRTSKFSKTISRTLNTGKYESIVISETIEEEFSWSTIEEWNKKHDNWCQLLVERFKRTHDYVLNELNLEHKQAFFKTLDDKDNRMEPAEAKILEGLDVLG